MIGNSGSAFCSLAHGRSDFDTINIHGCHTLITIILNQNGPRTERLIRIPARRSAKNSIYQRIKLLTKVIHCTTIHRTELRWRSTRVWPTRCITICRLSETSIHVQDIFSKLNLSCNASQARGLRTLSPTYGAHDQQERNDREERHERPPRSMFGHIESRLVRCWSCEGIFCHSTSPANDQGQRTVLRSAGSPCSSRLVRSQSVLKIPLGLRRQSRIATTSTNSASTLDFAMIVILATHRVVTQQIIATNHAIHDMDNRNFIRRKHFRSSHPHQNDL